MTLEVFQREVASAAQLGDNDRIWFPRWVRRYALSCSKGMTANLPVTRHGVVRFSKTLRDSGAPAWQRWQAVRAVALYRDLVLRRNQPDLSDMVTALAALGKKERNSPLEAPPTQEELARLRGKLNPDEPTLIQTLRGELRVLHYAMATERAYAQWVKRFSSHVGSMDLEQFNELDIGSFLTCLAVEGNVSASTQRQAQSALLFFYQCVIGKELGFISAGRVKKSEPIPVWFSRDEITKLVDNLMGTHRLMFLLMYGARLRHKECRRLRIIQVASSFDALIINA